MTVPDYPERGDPVFLFPDEPGNWEPGEANGPVKDTAISRINFSALGAMIITHGILPLRASAKPSASLCEKPRAQSTD